VAIFFREREMTDGMAGSDKRSLRGIVYQTEIFEIP
jgi:hypothetical protein